MRVFSSETSESAPALNPPDQTTLYVFKSLLFVVFAITSTVTMVRVFGLRSPQPTTDKKRDAAAELVGCGCFCVCSLVLCVSLSLRLSHSVCVYLSRARITARSSLGSCQRPCLLIETETERANNHKQPRYQQQQQTHNAQAHTQDKMREAKTMK